MKCRKILNRNNNTNNNNCDDDDDENDGSDDDNDIQNPHQAERNDNDEGDANMTRMLKNP